MNDSKDKINTTEALKENDQKLKDKTKSEEQIPTQEGQKEASDAENKEQDKNPEEPKNTSYQKYWEKDVDAEEERKILDEIKMIENNNHHIEVLKQEDFMSPAKVEDKKDIKEEVADPQFKNKNKQNSPNKKHNKSQFPVSLGETLVSEMVVDPFNERDPSSKSSNKSSLSNFTPAQTPKEEQKENIESQQDRQRQQQNQEQNISGSIKDQTSDSDMYEDSQLKNSDIRALLRKRELQVQNPVQFNVMVVGETGLGKSTFIDAFLMKKYEQHNQIRPSTQNITSREGTRFYNGMTLKICMIDTPGYGPTREIVDWYSLIKQYISTKFEEYKIEKANRLKEKKISLATQINDERVHLILYFLSGPRISQKDLVYMKKLKEYANIVPILARGDSFTIQEIIEIKHKIIQEAIDYKIDWFEFGDALQDNHEKLNQLNNGTFGPCPPFVMISSLTKIRLPTTNEVIYGREYSWGICNIENPDHSDFTLLSTLLGGHICLEAIQLTDYYYKKYFKKRKEKEKKEDTDYAKYGIGALLIGSALGIIVAAKKKLFS